MKRTVLITLFMLLSSSLLFAQQDFKSEEELKQKANELFKKQQLIEAKPLFTQLLSLYPKDPNYNYKYGACLMASQANKEEAITYLQFASSSANVEPLAFYYLGKAHHLNYNFGKAVKAYSKFKNKGSSELKSKYQIERQIEMAKNGNKLLSKINEVQVLDKQEISESDFFRIYDLNGIDGKIISKPEDFMTKYDKKIGERSIIYLPQNAKEVYYSSYGKKGETGRDIYKSVKLGNGNWSEPVKLGQGINTDFDENYAFIHPDGRTLYFASKGHSSMGGYDLFFSIFDQATNEWTAPENLDFAFSSADDDVLFITDQDKELAFFASNRTNAMGQMTVYKVKVKKEPADITIIQGEFIAENDPTAKKAKITVIDPETNKTIGVYTTDANGKYQVEINKRGGAYKFNIETTEDAPIHTGMVNVPDQAEFEVLGQELRLVGDGDQQQLVIKNIFDGTATPRNQVGPQISARLLREKANLDVNVDAAALADLESNRDREAARSNSNPTITTPQVTDRDANDGSATNDNNSNQNSSSSLSDAKKTELLEQLNEAEKNINERISQLEKAKNIAFEDAKTNAAEANKGYESYDSSTSSDEEKLAIKEEAGRQALLAAYGTSIGNELNSRLQAANRMNDQINSSRQKLQNENTDSDVANTIQASNDFLATQSGVESYFEEKLSKLQNDVLVNAEKSEQLNKRVQSFGDEKSKLEQRIDSLETLANNAEGTEKDNFTSQADDYKIDLQDINFQTNNAERDYQATLDRENALQVELEQIEILSQNYQQNEAPTEINASEIQALNQQIEDFKSNQKLAYEANDSQQSFGSDQNTDTKPEDFSSTTSLNAYYQDKIYKTEGISDPDLRMAEKLEIYKDWKGDLEGRKNSKQEELTQESNDIVKDQIQSQIKQIDVKLNEIEIASRTTTEDLADASNPSRNTNNNNNAREEEPLDLKNINLENPIEQSIDVSSVNENSIIPDTYTDLSYNQTLGYGSSNSKLQVRSAKKAYAQAATYAKKANDMRRAAFALPSVDARNKAFNKAMEYESAGVIQELKTANYYAQANASEFKRNEDLINNSDNYGEEFESKNLDIADLLADEARIYYNSALEIRAVIDPNDRPTKQKADLQKAYDFEVLALEKQREALDVLKVVDSEYQQTGTASTFDLDAAAAIEIIDPTVLNTKDAVLAINRADSLANSARQIEAQINNLNEDLIAASTDEEKLQISAQIETLTEEKSRLVNLSDQYYARAEEIKREDGYSTSTVDDLLANNSGSSKVTQPVFNDAKVLTSVDLDTVEINSERREIVIASNEYIEYSAAAAELKNAIEKADSDYQLALTLEEEKSKLVKEAELIQQQISEATDEEEKQRLMKSAAVIDQNIQNKTKSLDSLNALILDQNQVIASLEESMAASIASLSEIEKAEIIKLSNENLGQPALAADYGNEPSNDGSTTDISDELVSQESSRDGANLEDLPSDNTAVGRETNRDETNVSANRIDQLDSKGPITASSTVQQLRASGAISRIPQTVESTIFYTLPQSESYYDANNPIPVDPKMPEGLVYKVQIGAFRNPIPQDIFKGFAPLMAEKIPSGITRYTAGLFVNEKDAILARNEIRKLGYSDAFVVAFLNGERIGLYKARKTDNSAKSLSREELNPSSSSTSSTAKIVKSTRGSTQGLSNRFYESSVISAKNVETVEGLFYTVQIGVFSKPLKDQKFANYDNLIVKELSGGLIRYNSGVFKTASSANDQKATIVDEIKDAFVVAYYQGKRISLNEAARLQNR